ncbi:MAG: hypothetical protein UHY90_03315, partial [Treponema sp.]|nr:hypothetical protein [Treponema sp.]
DLLLAVNAMLASKIQREQIYELYRILNATKEKAEYKVKLFTEALKPEEKKRKSTAKTGTKKAAVKKETKTVSKKTTKSK